MISSDIQTNDIHWSGIHLERFDYITTFTVQATATALLSNHPVNGTEETFNILLKTISPREKTDKNRKTPICKVDVNA